MREWHNDKFGLKDAIANSRSVMLFLEIICEYRDLSVEEWNFKEALRTHLLKQRSTVKWVTLGNAGTKFFHANATIRHIGNLIKELTSEDGTVVSNHTIKEKNHMGGLHGKTELITIGWPPFGPYSICSN